MLNGSLFSLMKPNATFINTGRGAQVVEADLIDALKAEPNRVALLDVTMPEPPKPDSLFYKMDNVFLSPHIAGSHRRRSRAHGRIYARGIHAVDKRRADKVVGQPENARDNGLISC